MAHPTSLAAGRYLLTAVVGEGGMATVFRAFDQRLQVWRAIKLLSLEYSTKPKLRARFEAEAQTMALLEHPHIVRVYDVGVDGEYTYIVMELVEGGSLVDWVEKYGPMPSRLAVEVTLEFCEGIQAAHAKGVIHRDIKPHNVLVTRDGKIRVTDFGIARVGDLEMSMTKTGAVMGTWGYMAPEQRTNAKAVDERADVYATAATLYTLLTGRMPMDLFASDRDSSMMEGIPEVLLPILTQATSYHREQRPQSIAAFAEALRAVRDALPPIPSDTPPIAPVELDQLVAPTSDITGTVRVGLPAKGATLAPSDEDLPSEEQMVAVAQSLPKTPLPLHDVSAVTKKTSNQAIMLIAFGMVGLFSLVGGVGGVWVWSRYHSQQSAPVSLDLSPDTGVLSSVMVAPPPPETPLTQTVIVEKEKSTTPSQKIIAEKPTLPTPAPAEKPIGIETPPEPVVRPPKIEQCLKVNASVVKGSGIVSAKLCDEDGTEVVLWVRPPDGVWQRRNMPLVLGAHSAKIQLSGEYSAGAEYYVVAGRSRYGSEENPKTIKP